jgi:hypothetical protein
MNNDLLSFLEEQMRRQYLHLSAYSCDNCAGPVVSGLLTIRENEISKETDIRQVGAMCLSCGHRQNKATEPAPARHFSPVEWEPMGEGSFDDHISGVAQPRRTTLSSELSTCRPPL